MKGLAEEAWSVVVMPRVVPPASFAARGGGHDARVAARQDGEAGARRRVAGVARHLLDLRPPAVARLLAAHDRADESSPHGCTSCLTRLCLRATSRAAVRAAMRALAASLPPVMPYSA